jgi:hypothetical protein
MYGAPFGPRLRRFILTDPKFMFKCVLCGSRYQHGPHRYEGPALKLYGSIFCCDTCWRGNHDGWAPHLEHVLLAQRQTKKSGACRLILGGRERVSLDLLNMPAALPLSRRSRQGIGVIPLAY